MSTRECLLMTPVILIKACLLMSLSFLRLARAISPNLLIFRITFHINKQTNNLQDTTMVLMVVNKTVAWLVKERNYFNIRNYWQKHPIHLYTLSLYLLLLYLTNYYCYLFFKAKSLIPKLPFLWCCELLRVQNKNNEAN